MRNGADLSSIQHFLGHSQLQTTAIYLHTDEQQLQKIAGLASFRPQAEKKEPAPPEANGKRQAEAGRMQRRSGRGHRSG